MCLFKLWRVEADIVEWHRKKQSDDAKVFTILRTIMFPTAGGKERLQYKSSQLTELSLPIYEHALT